MNNENKNLFYLHELSDYKVADDYPDVRGWGIIDTGGKKIGEVESLLVNKAAKRVVYLNIEVDDDFIQTSKEKHAISANGTAIDLASSDEENFLILPIGAVTLDEDNEKVHTPGINFDTFAGAKRYKQGSNLDRNYEVAVVSHFDPTFSNGDESTSDEVFYEHKVFRTN